MIWRPGPHRGGPIWGPAAAWLCRNRPVFRGRTRPARPIPDCILMDQTWRPVRTHHAPRDGRISSPGRVAGPPRTARRALPCASQNRIVKEQVTRSRPYSQRISAVIPYISYFCSPCFCRRRDSRSGSPSAPGRRPGPPKARSSSRARLSTVPPRGPDGAGGGTALRRAAACRARALAFRRLSFAFPRPPLFRRFVRQRCRTRNAG